MQVLADDSHNWFLLEDDGALYLDVNASHGAAGLLMTIRLTEREAALYREGGRPFLTGLAHRVSGEGVLCERNLGVPLRAAVSEAVGRWRASGAAPPAPA